MQALKLSTIVKVVESAVVLLMKPRRNIVVVRSIQNRKQFEQVLGQLLEPDVPN